MCRFFEVSRSGYYDFVRRIGQAESDAELAKKIQECQDRTDKTYGYRRAWKWLKDRNIEKNPKTVLRVMKKYGLLSEIRRRRKWASLGQQAHKYENLLNRQFRTDRPNTKWVTDISYIRDPFVVWPVSLKLSVEQILVFVKLPPHLSPFSATANFGQKIIFFHNTQDCFRIPVYFLHIFQPSPHPTIPISLVAFDLLLANYLSQSRIVRRLILAFDIVVITAA